MLWLMDPLQEGIERAVAALSGQLPGWLVWAAYDGHGWRYCATFLREPQINATGGTPEKLAAACAEAMAAAVRRPLATPDVPAAGNYAGHL